MSSASIAPSELSSGETQRLCGVLTAIFDRGYGFLSTGRGKPSYFVLLRDVGAEHWIKGQRFSFEPAPPRAGTKTPRAIHLDPTAGEQDS